MIALSRSVVRSLVRPTPLWAILYLVRRCNLSCAYCGFKDDTIPDPPLELLFSAIDKIRELGCRFVSLTGGEPTLRRDLPEVISHCRRRGVVSYLNTNGTLLTREYLSRLCAAGLDMVNLSVDAVAQQADSAKDVGRQARSLTYLLEAREEYGFELISNQVLSPRTLSSAPALVEYMSARDVAVAHGLRYPIGDGYSPDGQPCCEDAIERLRSMRRKGYGMLTSIGYLDAVRRRLRGEEEWECDAGSSFFVIDVDGRVGICDRHRLREMTFEQLTPANYNLLAEDGRALKEAEKCHRECLFNCAYETSYFCRHKFRYLADQVLGIRPTERRTA